MNSLFKTDWVNKVLDNAPGPIKVLFDHHRYTTLAAILAFFVVSTNGCGYLREPTTQNPLSATTQAVTQRQLVEHFEQWKVDFQLRMQAMEAEAKAVPAKFQRADEDISAQIARQNALIAAVDEGIMAAGSGVPGMGTIWKLAVGALGITSIGAMSDNVRKGFKISNLQAGVFTAQDLPGAGDTVMGSNR